jgi:hypothetical protein
VVSRNEEGAVDEKARMLSAFVYADALKYDCPGIELPYWGIRSAGDIGLG